MNQLEKYAAKQHLTQALAAELEKQAVWGGIAKGLGWAAKHMTRGAVRAGTKTRAYRYAPNAANPYGSRVGRQILGKHGPNTLRGKLSDKMFAGARGLRRLQGGATRKLDKQWANRINKRSFSGGSKDVRWHEHENRIRTMKNNPMLNAGLRKGDKYHVAQNSAAW
jgi:hypothetical protein